MSFYTRCYYNICEKGKQAKILYFPFSGLHEHHIIPRHSGGTDDDSNMTYLTVREHTIAHFLLWKIHNNINDLRSMKMLGANLSVKKRIMVGIWCKENKIGIHGYSRKQRRENGLKGLDTQKKLGSEKSFYFWSTEEGRKKRASMGGKASLASGNNNEFAYWMSPAGLKERAIMGGKSHLGKKPMYKPGDKSFVRVSPKDVDNYLEKGYIFGSPIIPKSKGTKTNIPSVRRKKVTDGIKIYDSVEIAAKENNITPGAVVYRCKSTKNINWNYVS